MPTKSVAIVAMLAVLLFARCGKSETMKSIEATDVYVEEHPDSAMRVLAALDTNKLRGTRERAAYAVALTNARWLAYSPEFSDTLLRPFKTYFENSGPSRDKMLYCYLSGINAREKEQYSNAVLLGLEAADIAQRHDDYFYLGRAYGLVHDTYTDMWNGEQGLKYARMAYEAFMKCGKKRHAYWMYGSVCQAYNNVHDIDKCSKSLDTLQNIAKEYLKEDPALEDVVKRIDARMARKESDYRKCVNLIRSMKCAHISSDYYDLGYSYMQMGMIDSAMVYNDSLLLLTPVERDIAVQISKAQGDFKGAYENLSKAYKNQTNTVNHVIDENTGGREAEFYELKAANRGLQVRNLWIVISCLLVTLLSGIAIIIIVHRNKTNQRRIKVEKYLVTLELMQRELDETRCKFAEVKKSREYEKTEYEARIKQEEKTQAKLEKKAQDMNDKYKVLESHFRNICNSFGDRKEGEQVVEVLQNEINRRFAFISELCETIHQKTSTDDSGSESCSTEANIAERNALAIKNFHSIIKRTTLSDKSRKELEVLVDKSFGGVMTILHRELPKTYSKYGRIYLFRVLGLSNPAIAFLLNTDAKTLSNMLYRLRLALKNSDFAEKERLLSLL